MLFRYRPPQTWMPYRRPRPPMQQDAYNLQLQDDFDATRRAPAPVPTASDLVPVQALQDLAALRASGDLTDDEFASAKTRLLNRT